jgi:predicted phosphate transport protein (TIGR00153 family)
VKLRLTPRETSFYDLFAEQADHLVVGAGILTELLGATGPAAEGERNKIAERMRAAEHAADDTTHKIYNTLNSSFITPFDREDIYALASTLDDVMDEMEEAVDLVNLYGIETLPSGVAEQVDTLVRAAELTAEAMRKLRGMKDLSGYWIEVNRLENAGDQSYRKLLAHLFSGEYDANTVESIVVKES